MRLARLLPPLATLACALAAWQFAVTVLQVPSYLLPSPASVARSLLAGFAEGTIWAHVGYTTAETVAGWSIGSGIALVLGSLLAESKRFERFAYPLLVAAQATPKVALAPLILVWFGFGIASKVVLVALICFFPLFVNTMVGIRRTDAELIDACRAFCASRAWLFLHVKLPSAAGDVFAGLQSGFSLALIGAVVGELVSSERGLGYLIGVAGTDLDTATMFAAVLLLALLGVAGVQAVRSLHERVVFWERPPDPIDTAPDSPAPPAPNPD